MYSTSKFQPARFEATGTLTLRGQTVPYHTVCEDNVFYNDQGEPIATVFSYSYFRSDISDSSSRPVLFCFNGGPGASSMLVHAGCFGAKRVQYPKTPEIHPSLPPFSVIDNPDCLLDIADLVMVDPIGTGFGLLLDESSDKLFYGIDEDAEALINFVSSWLTRYGRWDSPKYLVGESYGCTRAATAAAIGCFGGKKQTYNVTFNGVIFIGNTVTVTKYFNRGAPIESAVEALPTMAAINWYHLHPSEATLEDFVYEAADFAAKEYLAALYQGEALLGEEREAIKKKLMYYTGASSEYLDSHDLRLERSSFCHDILKNQNKVVSLVDGRFTRPSIQPLCAEEKFSFMADGTSRRYDPFFMGALYGQIFPALSICDFDRPFVPSCSFGTELAPGSRWNFENDCFVSGERLASVMQTIPGMRTLFLNGWFDLVTQTGIVWHTMNHLRLPHDRTTFKGYPSGHMAYLGEENVKAVSEDIRTFISEQPLTLPASSVHSSNMGHCVFL